MIGDSESVLKWFERIFHPHSERITNNAYRKAICFAPEDWSIVDGSIESTYPMWLHRLQYTIGLTGNAHNWFTSYLTGRSEHVALGKAKSHTHSVTCDVLQGSVLGPTFSPSTCFPWAASSAGMGYLTIAMLMTHSCTSEPPPLLLAPCQHPHWPPAWRR